MNALRSNGYTKLCRMPPQYKLAVLGVFVGTLFGSANHSGQGKGQAINSTSVTSAEGFADAFRMILDACSNWFEGLKGMPQIGEDSPTQVTNGIQTSSHIFHWKPKVSLPASIYCRIEQEESRGKSGAYHINISYPPTYLCLGNYDGAVVAKLLEAALGPGFTKNSYSSPQISSVLFGKVMAATSIEAPVASVYWGVDIKTRYGSATYIEINAPMGPGTTGISSGCLLIIGATPKILTEL